MPKSVPLIAVVDEDGFSLRESKQLLEFENPEAVVMPLGSAHRAKDLLKNEDLALVVTDVSFGDGYSGKNLIEALRMSGANKAVSIIVLTKRALSNAERKELEGLNVTIEAKPLRLEFLRSYLSKNPIISVSDGAPIEKKQLSKGSFLFKENEQGDSLFLLQTGKLEALKQRSPTSTDLLVISEILPGQIVGEMAILDGQPRSLSVRAIEDSLLLEIRASDLRAHLANQPSWLRILIESALDRLRRMNEKLASR